MINVKEFLDKNYNEEKYYLVTYNGITEATYFTKYNLDGEGYWYLESPCELMVECEINKEDKEKFYEDWCWSFYEPNNNDEAKYIKSYLKRMTIENTIYSIENFQTAPYLPKEVDSIEEITDRECLIYLLEHNKK